LLLVCDATLCNYHGTCNATGLCSCDPSFDTATNCSSCSANHYDYPTCSCTYQFIACIYLLFIILNVTFFIVFYLIFYCDPQIVMLLYVITTELAMAPAYALVIQALMWLQIAVLAHQTITTTPLARVCICYFSPYTQFLLSFYYNTIVCDSSLCNNHGTCNDTGLCTCDPSFDSSTNCSSCSLNHYNYPSCSCTYLSILFSLDILLSP
jgi:EGF-like domain